MQLPRRRPLSGYLAAAAAVLLIAALMGTVYWWAGRDQATTVPDLVGLTLPQATAAADAAGLALLAEEGAEVEGAVVTIQDPSGGTATTTGELIRVSLAPPIREVTVPDLTGIGIDEATGILADTGLTVASVGRADAADLPPGTVVRQEPEPGTVLDEGRGVRLWTAQASVTAPELAGLTEQAADRVAQEAGLSLEFLYESSDETAPGTVIRQIPAAGTLLEPGAQLVAVVNGAAEQPADGAEEPVASPLYRSLAAAYSFPVLYPAVLPPQLRLAGGADNPRHVLEANGETGFEIRYDHATAPGAGLALMEGNWFETGGDYETTVDVRGRPAAFMRDGEELIVSWREEDVRYAVRATGLEDGEVLAFVNGLEVVSGP